MFHVRRSLIEGLLKVAEAFLSRGLVLRVEDGYRRPQLQAMGASSPYVVRTVIEKVMWELDGEMPGAELVFRRLAVWSATTPIFANHTSGSAVDVSALRREDGSLIDLGAPYPELSHRTPMTSPFVSRQARRNREMVCDLFAEEQFAPYPYEFWHFSHGDADYEVVLGSGRAARFGPVHLDADCGRPTPVKDIRKPFVTIEDILPYLDDEGRD
jgi:D-alanyl-D-alanine dipeptidase